MIDAAFAALESANDFLWGHVGVALIVGAGALVSHQLGWVQLFSPLRVLRTALALLTERPASEKAAGTPQRGVTPARAFFASLGECVGIGNIVTVAVGVQIGGPGVLLWMWIVALLGMALKYGEVYLGITYRQPNHQGSYDGGPMYVLAHAFPACERWLPAVAAFLLCVYGVEVYMFGVIKEAVVTSWSLPNAGVTVALLALIIPGVMGGVKRIGAISGTLIPLFGTIFLGMTLAVLVDHARELPNLLLTIARSAFRGHEAVGSFAGSAFILTMSRGLASACYSGDVGIGYASTIHSESQAQNPSRQASLSMLGIVIDTAVCTCVVLLLLVTGVWAEPVSGSLAVQTALAQYFPHMDLFMPIFLFSLGYTSISACMLVGLKAARFLHARRGTPVYWVCGIVIFLVFSTIDPKHALTVMSLAGGLLMIVNCVALLRLRGEIRFAPENK